MAGGVVECIAGENWKLGNVFITFKMVTSE